MKNKEVLVKKSESSEQIAFFHWVRIQGCTDERFKTIFAISNGMHSSAKAGFRAKREGLRAGISDVFVPIASRGYHGLFIEFKIKPNKLSDKQEEFFKRVHGQGFACRIAWSADDAIKILKEYLCAMD